MKKFLLWFLLALPCVAQTYDRTDDGGNYPGPTHFAIASCTMNNGKPCPLWLYKLIGQYPPLVESTRYLAPQPPAGFFTFRKNWNDPVLRPNKTSWAMFTGVHAVAWFALAKACRNPRSGEDWGSEAPAAAALTTVFDFAMFKLISPSFSIEIPAYMSYHYFSAAQR